MTDSPGYAADAAYVPPNEQHFCLLPPITRHLVPIEAMQVLRVGTVWDCPECGLRYTVARIGHGPTEWISTGPAGGAP